MQRRCKLIQKTVAFIAVFMLIVMMLPTAAFAAGNGKGKGSERSELAHQAKIERDEARVKGEDDPEDQEVVETEVDTEEMSAWAIYVHERKDWAANHDMSPGHANLLDKLFAMDQALLGEDETLVFNHDAFSQKYATYLAKNTVFSVKTVILAIKEARNTARVTAATLESIE